MRPAPMKPTRSMWKFGPPRTVSAPGHSTPHRDSVELAWFFGGRDPWKAGGHEDTGLQRDHNSLAVIGLVDALRHPVRHVVTLARHRPALPADQAKLVVLAAQPEVHLRRVVCVSELLPVRWLRRGVVRSGHIEIRVNRPVSGRGRSAPVVVLQVVPNAWDTGLRPPVPDTVVGNDDRAGGCYTVVRPPDPAYLLHGVSM